MYLCLIYIKKWNFYDIFKKKLERSELYQKRNFNIKGSLQKNCVFYDIRLKGGWVPVSKHNKIGHSSRSSSIQRSKTTEEVSGNVKQF